jgi:hypothetical protein
MKTRSILIACMIIIVLAGAIAAGRIIASSSDHQVVTVSLAQEDHPSNFAALAGSWEGMWSGVLSSRLVVEDIHGKWATILYAWGDYPNGGVRQGEARTRVKILPDGRLQLGALNFAPSDDGAHLIGRWEQAGLSATVVMTRVAPGIPANSLTATVATD